MISSRKKGEEKFTSAREKCEMEEKQISISGRGEGRQIGVEFERRKTGFFSSEENQVKKFSSKEN